MDIILLKSILLYIDTRLLDANLKLLRATTGSSMAIMYNKIDANKLAIEIATLNSIRADITSGKIDAKYDEYCIENGLDRNGDKFSV